MGMFENCRQIVKSLRAQVEDYNSTFKRLDDPPPAVIAVPVEKLEKLLDRCDHLEDMADVSFGLSDRFRESLAIHGRTKWISVEDSLPDPDTPVFVWQPDWKSAFVAQIDSEGWWSEHNSGDSDGLSLNGPPSHWAVIRSPEPVK